VSARGANPNDPELQVHAFSTTYLFACAQPHLCARALGLFLLRRDRPAEFTKYKVFAEEFNRIMLPVFKAQEEGKIDQLHKRYNPSLANEMSAARLFEVPETLNQPPHVVGRCPQCSGDIVMKTIGTLKYLKCAKCTQIFSNRNS
jgi:hypothetical protein